MMGEDGHASTENPIPTAIRLEPEDDTRKEKRLRRLRIMVMCPVTISVHASQPIFKLQLKEFPAMVLEHMFRMPEP
jgi:hypothetical protein